MQDIELLNSVADNIQGRTICALGDAAAMPVRGDDQALPRRVRRTTIENNAAGARWRIGPADSASELPQPRRRCSTAWPRPRLGVKQR